MVKRKRLLLTLLAVVLCMTAVFPAALATGGEYQKEELPAETAQAQTEEPAKDKETSAAKTSDKDKTAEAEKTDAAAESTEKNSGETSTDTKALTPEGNLTLVDDVTETADKDSTELEEKQFLTVQSKSGNTFYLIIDRSGDEENVYFLNLVDEADLMALTDGEETEEEPAVCTCTDKCAAGSVDTTCPVCSVNMSQCLGTEPVEEEDDPDDEAPSGIGLGGLLLFLVLGAAGGAFYYFKIRKPKANTRGADDLDAYDYGEDDEEYEEEDEAEDFSDSEEE